MKIYIINHNFHYEIENLTRVFFPNEKLELIKADSVDGFEYPCIITRIDDDEKGKTVFVEINLDNKKESCSALVKPENSTEDYTAEQEREMAICLYKLLTAYTGMTPPWGILTGVRPIKLFRRLTDQYGLEYTKNYFKSSLLVTDEKISLAEETEKNEQAILSLSTNNSYSLYVSIPFCPSRCSYCSFVSQSVEKAKKLIEPYVELLCKELEHTAKIADDLKLKLETVYIGGGTPTTLNAQQLERLISVINQYFPMEQCKEFTVEAGRPDTVTEDKLRALINGGVNRISINPQTMNDDILVEIGRKHTAQQTIDAFNMARKIGFKHINMDLIVGLPNENFESFKNTLEIITDLNPESITVHTLSMKRSAYLTAQGMQLLKHDAQQASKMHTYCRQLLADKGLRPYYLYRQSRMVGNLENIGYAKKGFDGLYNVYVMDETHTILGCGAGAVTKLKDPSTGVLQRIFNYKYPYEYNNSFEEMLKRKEGINEFYKEYFNK
ncbi:MAG: coproporphyrinogen dehydrogenase HemZ [Acutalibacteraceae bacterium]|nr:coproporphyrinogen dehydrogenase HemZ [Acutalibacteraceae bacterium]